MKYEIIATGSDGNAVVLEDEFLIDCGVPFKVLKDVYKNLKLVLLTHEHSDHFNPATIRKLAQERPLLRFGCGEWMIKKLIDCGVCRGNIDVYKLYENFRYESVTVIPFALFHDVPNCGYGIITAGGSAFYATDTVSLTGVRAPELDLYLIEANYDEDEIAQRIAEKQASGSYAYEMRVLKTHLSKQQADAFIYENAGANSEYVYLHQHKEKEAKQ